MQLIEGCTLEQHLAKPRRPRDVVALFATAGRGLAAAHAAGIVHRDIKPSNILVDRYGVARVGDFGLARAIGGDSADADAAAALADGAELVDGEPDGGGHRLLDSDLTHGGAVLGTPFYMAPEQHLGGMITPRADQFSFCVALYEALYHEHPFGDGPAMFDAVMAGKVRAAKPGAKVPGWVRKALLRGLERHGDRRYPDMGALLQDLLPERGGRRTWGIVAGLGALAAAAGVWGLAPRAAASVACQSGEALTARVWDGAARAAVSEAFARTGAPRAADNVAAVSRALDGYLSGWSRMYSEACRKTRVEKVQSVDVLDRRMLCLEGRLDAARRLVALIDRADAAMVSRATQAAYDLPSLSDCADPAALRHLAAQGGELAAKLREVQTLRTAGRFRDAMALAGDVMIAAREAGGPLLAQALLERGLLELNLGEDKSAVGTLTAAATTSLEQGDELGAAEAWGGLARVTSIGLGLLDEAERWARIAVAVAARAAAGTEREAEVRLTLAAVLTDRDRLDEADRETGQALTIYERQRGPDHPMTAQALRKRGHIAAARGKFAEARADYDRVEQIIKKAFGDHHPQYASALNDLGQIAYYEGKYRESIERYRQALTIQAEVFSPDHPEVGIAWRNLAIAYETANLLDEALDGYQKALAIAEKQGATHPNVAEALGSMGGAYHKLGSFQAAYDVNKRALPIQEKTYGPESREVGTRHMNLAVELKSMGRYAEADASFARAGEIFLKATGPDSFQTGIVLDNRAEVQRLLGRPRDGLESYRRAFAVLEKVMGKEHPVLADPLTGIGRCQLALGEAAAALSPLERALVMRQNDGDTDHNLAETRLALAQALIATRGDRARARDLLERSRKAYASYGDKRKRELGEVDATLRRL